MAGASFHIRCPACGQSFLSPIDHPYMAQACPACHFNGLRGQFIPVDEAPQPQVRREPKRFAPTAASGQAPAWNVQQYAPAERVAVQPSFHPAPSPPPPGPASPPIPGAAEWAAIQAYQEMMSARLRHEAPPAEPPAAPSSPPRQAADWARMKPSNLPKLTPWPGLDPVDGTVAETPDPWASGPRKRRMPWGWLLASVIVLGLIGTIVIERKRANEAMAKLAGETIATKAPAPADGPGEGGTIVKALPVDEKPDPRECRLTPEMTEPVLRPLVEQLFAATTDADRLACIDSADKNADSVKDFFARHGAVKLKTLAAVSKLVLCLPNKLPQPVFDVTTSISDQASGIVRLTTDRDGKLKLDWLLLRDSLDGAFAACQKLPTDAPPRWISLGLRRSYGFGEAPELRETNLFFDMQGYGNGLDKALVQVVKNSSTGRSMDQLLGWGDLYVVRALIGWQVYNGVPRLTIINAMLDDSGIGS